MDHTSVDCEENPSAKLMEDKENAQAMEKTEKAPTISNKSLIAFWFLGLCNNYGYVVMLAAALDILSTDFHYNPEGNTNSSTSSNTTFVRECTKMSTGAVLLADIIPSLAIKLVSPFFPLMIHFRMILIILLSAAGYILVAQAPSVSVAIAGVVCTALSSGLGEASLLSYMAIYKNKNIISTWSSGTGAAGLLGSFSYAGLTEVFGNRKVTLYALLVVPAIMAASFWILLEHPKKKKDNTDQENTKEKIVVPVENSESQVSFFRKLTLIPSLFKYMIPLFLVYLFEYFINHGLFELITFDTPILTHSGQYKWYQVDYQLGVLISRSSINLIQINKTWIFAICQFLCVVFFTTEAIFRYVPTIYIIFVGIFIEGLFGGGAYVNTYNRITYEVPDDKREFSMGMTSLADAVGISLAGFLAMPAHDAICNLPYF